MNRTTLAEFLEWIPSPNRTGCLALFHDHELRMKTAPGSSIKHQAWVGGYVDHLEEIMHIAVSLYEALSNIRPLPFTLADAILVLYLHDLEKPFKYIEPRTLFPDDESKKVFIETIMQHYAIVLTPDQHNALTYIHGEGDHHNPEKRIQGPLAAFVHCCDTISARIWFDEPKK